MSSTTDNIAMQISPKSPDSTWVALGKNDEILSEGQNPNEVLENAKKKSEDVFLMFIPKEGNTYIF